MKRILLITFLLSSTMLHAEVKSTNGMSKRWHTLNKLINQEINTIKAIGSLGPKLQHRLLELNSERIKLLKEQENQKFLSSKRSIIKAKGKKWFFRKSTAKYNQVKRDGYKLIKRFPRFRQKANIFYTLALNERDYGGDKKTEYYLLKVLKHAKKGDKIVHHAKTSLAEYHYNQKNYPLAINYYNAVLKNTKDDWYTKHLYNQAWCLLKERQYDQGISNLKIAFKFSKNPNYVSVTDQVLEAFAVFFVHGNQIADGIDFYVSSVKDPTDYLISMARKAASKGLFKETRDVIAASLTKSRELKLHSKEVDIRLLELEIYRNFKKFDLHFETSLALQELQKTKSFNDEQKEDATNKLKSLVNYLQIRISKNKKVGNTDYSPKKMKEVISYFDILSTIDHDNKDQYSFYSGETHFSVGNYKDAVSFYKSSIDNSKGKKGKETNKLRRKVLNSFLSALSKSNFDKKANHDNTVYAYQNHLNFWPKDPKSQKIYVKLYNLYLGKQNVKAALGTLNSYLKNYPKDQEIQRGMITHLMDQYIKQKNSVELANWIAKLETGFLGFKKSYVEKALAVLGQILFEEYEALEKSGNKDQAIAGYMALFTDKRYPRKIKAQSAYNASILFLDIADTKSSYLWVKNSISKHSKADLTSLLPKLEEMANRYALLQDFKRSSLLSRDLLKRFCQSNQKEKESFYQMAVHHQLIENNFSGAIQNSKLGQKCLIKEENIISLNKKMITHMANHRLYRSFFKFYDLHKDDETYFQTFSSHLINIYWDTKFTWKPKLHKSVSKILMTWKRENKLPEVFTKNLDFMKQYETYEKMVKRIKYTFPKMKKFNEKMFNQTLESNLSLLQRITKEGESLIKQGHKEMTLLTYSLLENQYISLANTIKDFSPRGMPKEFVQGFKKHMSGLSTNLLDKGRSYTVGAITVIEKNNILSFNNFKFIKPNKFMEKVKFRYPASKLVSTADLGGDQ
ncbi:MAG: tetratricopeptide repeat protein [Bacteriovoracaceae bacterium]|nr:tetratricopeptide repeat protein [Bacteriovoracaceae bacterium]